MKNYSFKMAVNKKVKMKNVDQKKAAIASKKEKEVPTATASDFDPYHILKAPLSTEKAIRSIEFENKLTFVVNPEATKQEVKKAVEVLFNVKVLKVNVQNSFKGQKRAYVKLSSEHSASDISADLGLI